MNIFVMVENKKLYFTLSDLAINHVLFSLFQKNTKQQFIKIIHFN
jgi:hypothetical protein